MIRRDARKRREYIFRKSLQPKFRAEYKAKRDLQSALDGGKKVPETLRSKFDRLNEENKADDVHTKSKSHLDDEYALSGIKDPKLLLTTCRNPTNKLLRFVKEMKLCLPNSVRVNRGITLTHLSFF